MILSAENILLIGSILLFISVLASKTSFRLGIPTLIFFIFVGMLAGSDGPGGIYFDDPKAVQILGVIALNFILFSGGLDTRRKDVQPVIWRGVVLSTVGVAITAGTVGLFANWLTDLSLTEGLLLGAIVSSTDAAAVFAVLRTRRVDLKESLRPTLELESGSNDPMAYFLTISFIQLIKTPEVGVWEFAAGFVIQMVLGALCGWTMGRVMNYTLKKARLNIYGLYPVLLLSLIFFTFSATDFVGGNGYLAVYLAGIVLGNKPFKHKESLTVFYDGQAWLMQVIMFLTLGLLVFPKQLIDVTGIGLLLSAILIFISRPIAVFISLAFFRLGIRNLLFISWVGLRGAVPIIFATFPLVEQLEHARFIFNVVFYISLTSVLFQGSTLTMVARWLNVAQEAKEETELPEPEETKIKEPIA